jgi:glycosyltransferase involved in cell wall biosynthesis
VFLISRIGIILNSNRQAGVTCIIPARNESGHIEEVVSHALSIPEISEIVIIEGGSTDDTWAKIKEIEQKTPEIVRCFQQTGKGKFNAVLEGASEAQFKYSIIWDADGTVPIQCTKRILHHSLTTGNATMGDRLRGNIEKSAMQPANFLGNWAFAILWSPVINSKPRDMLCGTKVFETDVFISIPSELRISDPYGDFALVATARLLGKKVDSVIVDYKARTYGETNIHRWSGGISLLKTSVLVYKMIIKKKINESKFKELR